MPAAAQLLTDPFLQLPTAHTVRVVWFTEFPGREHAVVYGERNRHRVAAATALLSRTREDERSHLLPNLDNPQRFQHPVRRKIWRHEAEITGLTPGDRLPYYVCSQHENGTVAQSDRFTLAPLPPTDAALKILLTSDHQLMPMTAANLQKASETAGRIDAVIHAGDLVNVPDRASEWFDDTRGRAFFPCLQGRAHSTLEYDGRSTTYRGAAIVQHAPLFPTIGNHEVMGRDTSETANLRSRFADAIPLAVARERYEAIAARVNPQNDPELRAQWLKNLAFNIDTYSEIFSLPPGSDGKKYYALTFGNVRLISLFATNIWRPYSLDPDLPGRYCEAAADRGTPDRWGYGQHIFEPIHRHSPQYRWLEKEVRSPQFHAARYKIVTLHHPPHTLGGNIVPAYTDPVQIIERDARGAIAAVRYEYPKSKDYLIRDLLPLLEAAGVHLVLFGHSHLWNRFVSPSGMHFLETSNVGNTYGAHPASHPRPIPAGYREEYVAVGDPNGLEPVMPTLAPLADTDGRPLPYIASNEISAFSLLETATGTLSSYRFDTRCPDSGTIKFDEFQLDRSGR